MGMAQGPTPQDYQVIKSRIRNKFVSGYYLSCSTILTDEEILEAIEEITREIVDLLD